MDFTITTDGSISWTVEHKFQERQVKVGANVYGWNHSYDPIRQQWDKMKTAAGDFDYPESANFNNLFV